MCEFVNYSNYDAHRPVVYIETVLFYREKLREIKLFKKQFKRYRPLGVFLEGQGRKLVQKAPQRGHFVGDIGKPFFRVNSTQIEKSSNLFF